MSGLAAFCVLCQNVALGNIVISVCFTVVRFPLENLLEVRASYGDQCIFIYDKLALSERKFVVGKMIEINILNGSTPASRKLFIFQFRLFPDELVVSFN